MKDKIHVDGQAISVQLVNDQDYISLTDIAKRRNNQTTDTVIQAWLKNGSTLDFLELWEQFNNPDFKPLQMQGIRVELARNANYLSASQFIERTGAIGIQSKRGRYGGTFAHVDIAFEFASWVDAKFKLYLITEFKRLKSEEMQRQKLEWDVNRYFSKVNYDFQTRAISDNISKRLPASEQAFPYASEADMLNQIVFGMTARQWRESNPDAKGNIRDAASMAELLILANLESINAMLIEAGASQEARYKRLCKVVEFQLKVLAERSDKYLLE